VTDATLTTCEKQVLSAIHAGRKAHRIRHVSGMEVRKQRPRGFK
jgi:hypothetical protein